MEFAMLGKLVWPLDTSFLTRQEENSLGIWGFRDNSRKNWFPKELLWYYDIDEIEKDIEASSTVINPANPITDSFFRERPHCPINSLKSTKRKRPTVEEGPNKPKTVEESQASVSRFGTLPNVRSREMTGYS
jgi:hypothetical protein